MKFEIYINDPIIHKAANLVETHFKDQAFLNILCGIEKFNFTNDTGRDVATKIANSDLKMQIKPYTAWSPWSKAIGYASKLIIWCNTRKLHLPLIDRTQNFAHEPLHLLGYSHKGNSVTLFNLGTVPFKVSDIFIKYLISIGKL